MRRPDQAIRRVAALIATATVVTAWPGAALATPAVAVSRISSAHAAPASPEASSTTPVVVDVASNVDPARLAQSLGVDPEIVFTEGDPGFAAAVTGNELTRLRRDPAVESVTRDRIVGHIAGRAAVRRPEQPAQVVKVAQRRVGLLSSRTADVDGRDDRRIDVDIAIFDTGIDPRHPDLNVAGGVDCASGRGWDDIDGHGTMVAGLAAAIDNRIGVVGIAPGARVWSVRIADPDGNIRDSALRCGLEWLDRHHKRIEVANFSFSDGDPYVGPCGVVDGRVADHLHALVCRAVRHGVTVVGAAGNDEIDAGTVSPSAWPEVITVSATAETDGLPGGLGPLPCLAGEFDDAIATFSNFGQAVDIAAPGVCVTSTYPHGLYAFDSGTSFSTPLVSGAAALVIARKPDASPEVVRRTLLRTAEPGPIPGDADGSAEGLLNVATL